MLVLGLITGLCLPDVTQGPNFVYDCHVSRIS